MSMPCPIDVRPFSNFSCNFPYIRLYILAPRYRDFVSVPTAVRSCCWCSFPSHYHVSYLGHASRSQNSKIQSGENNLIQIYWQQFWGVRLKRSLFLWFFFPMLSELQRWCNAFIAARVFVCLFTDWGWRRPGRLLLVPIPRQAANIRLIVAKVTKLSRKVDNANGMKKAAVCL